MTPKERKKEEIREKVQDLSDLSDLKFRKLKAAAAFNK